MSIPKYEAFMLPMLQLLADGRPRHLSDLRDELAQRFDISDADRQILQPSGRIRLFDNRVAWARTDLGMASAVESPSRGIVRITARGHELLAEGLQGIDRKILSRYPEFEAFMLRKRPRADAQADAAEQNLDGQEPIEASDGNQSVGSEVSTTDQDGNDQTSASLETLSFTDAAAVVLDRYAGKQPMHYRVVTQKILELGLVRTQGQTPEATLYAQILSEITRKSRQGNAPRFTRHGRGMVGLAAWAAGGLADQIDQHNWEARRQLLVHLAAIHPAEFEALIGRLLVALGFQEVLVTGRSGDGGIDVRGTLVVGDVIRTRMAVQVKRWRANVQAPIVQQVRGSLGTHDQGLIITTSDFSSGARTEAERVNAVPVALMNGEQLVRLLVEHEIGVRRVPYDLIELSPTTDPERHA
ncbi:MAG TPA: winged helix-turn-helix domain-containing protein [Chloroflexota bacterium]|nr:winged helix-turn-helix domain-containing protein [Chloroflexota bacterium]